MIWWKWLSWGSPQEKENKIYLCQSKVHLVFTTLVLANYQYLRLEPTCILQCCNTIWVIIKMALQQSLHWHKCILKNETIIKVIFSCNLFLKMELSYYKFITCHMENLSCSSFSANYYINAIWDGGDQHCCGFDKQLICVLIRVFLTIPLTIFIESQVRQAIIQ